MLRGGSTIIDNGAAQFEATGDFLRMIPQHTASRRKIRGAAENEVERLRFPRSRTDRESPLREFHNDFPIRCIGRFARQCNAFRLGFDGYKIRSGNRQAAIMPTEPSPLPRSNTVRAEGTHVVPYQAVRTSSVENRWPLRS